MRIASLSFLSLLSLASLSLADGPILWSWPAPTKVAGHIEKAETANDAYERGYRDGFNRERELAVKTEPQKALAPVPVSAPVVQPTYYQPQFYSRPAPVVRRAGGG